MGHSYHLRPLSALGDAGLESFRHDAGLPALETAGAIQLTGSGETVSVWPVSLEQLERLASRSQYHDGIHFFIYMLPEGGKSANRVKIGCFHFNIRQAREA